MWIVTTTGNLVNTDTASRIAANPDTHRVIITFGNDQHVVISEESSWKKAMEVMAMIQDGIRKNLAILDISAS